MVAETVEQVLSRQNRELRAENDKLKQLILLTDPVLSKHEMNTLSATQWSEFLRWKEQRPKDGPVRICRYDSCPSCKSSFAYKKPNDGGVCPWCFHALGVVWVAA